MLVRLYIEDRTAIALLDDAKHARSSSQLWLQWKSARLKRQQTHGSAHTPIRRPRTFANAASDSLLAQHVARAIHRLKEPRLATGL